MRCHKEEHGVEQAFRLAVRCQKMAALAAEAEVEFFSGGRSTAAAEADFDDSLPQA